MRPSAPCFDELSELIATMRKIKRLREGWSSDEKRKDDRKAEHVCSVRKQLRISEPTYVIHLDPLLWCYALGELRDQIQRNIFGLLETQKRLSNIEFLPRMFRPRILESLKQHWITVMSLRVKCVWNDLVDHAITNAFFKSIREIIHDCGANLQHDLTPLVWQCSELFLLCSSFGKDIYAMCIVPSTL